MHDILRGFRVIHALKSAYAIVNAESVCAAS